MKKVKGSVLIEYFLVLIVAFLALAYIAPTIYSLFNDKTIQDFSKIQTQSKQLSQDEIKKLHPLLQPFAKNMNIDKQQEDMEQE